MWIDDAFKNGTVTFKGSDLRLCSIKQVALDDFDLRLASYRLDDNSIRGTRFSPDSNDPYSLLRRKYTGFNFLLLSFLTLIALVPYVIKALVFSFIGKQESKVLQFGQELIAKEPGLKPIIEAHIIDHMVKFEEHPTWLVVLGGTEPFGILAIVLSILALLIVGVRAFVTFMVSGIREAEERSEHAPAWEDYRLYFLIHQKFLKFGTLFILSLSLYSFIKLLLQPVWLPIG
ncbi:hypothetical protein [Colwellia sp. PAMC 21821]|uniref:hypothetical protein n=1 Tax=Colwellia sp. PAMC 21821 TaxID=1816219 RepID=UPI0009BD8929|nr:hypothetical protein [Colwellia sp. PAMC 21821]ARD43801.1 hypothetical protein A3Q33_05440 [Colwellia sp. PAMC 21821]